jgi:hypothetical protein
VRDSRGLTQAARERVQVVADALGCTTGEALDWIVRACPYDAGGGSTRLDDPYRGGTLEEHCAFIRAEDADYREVWARRTGT